jgi:hypothetical protein
MFVVYLTTLFSYQDYIVSNDTVIRELEGSGSGLILKYIPCIRQERLRKTMETSALRAEI